MRTFKRLAVFLIVLALVTCCLDFMISQPSTLKILIKEAEKENINTIILGESHAETGLDPFKLGDGLTVNGQKCEAVCLAHRILPIADQYYLLKRVSDNNPNIGQVILEIDPTYWQGKSMYYPGKDASALPFCSFSDKIDYFGRILVKQNYNSAFFNYYIDETSLYYVPQNIICKLDPDYIAGNEKAIEKIYKTNGISFYYKYVGKGYRQGIKRNEKKRLPKGFKESNMNKSALESFDRIVELCEKRDIDLICFISALPAERIRDKDEDYDVIHNCFAKLCESKKVGFYDFNYIKAEHLARTTDYKDFTDEDGHLMADFSEKQTEAFISIFNSDDPSGMFYRSYDDAVSALKDVKYK